MYDLESRCKELGTFRHKIPEEEKERNLLDFNYECYHGDGDECKYYGVYCTQEKIYFVCKNNKEE